MMLILLGLILVVTPVLRGAVNPCVFMPAYIIILFISLICISRFFVNGQIRLRRTALDMAIALFFLVAVVSSLNSRYAYSAVMEMARFAGLVMIFYIVVNFITEEKDIRKILNLILMSAGAVAVLGIFQYLGALPKPWWDNPRFLSATYVNHNHFAGYLELVIPVSIGMALSEKESRKKALYICLFLILSIAFMLSMSRGGWFSLSISMIFMAVIIFKKGRARFIILVAALFAATLIIFVFNAVDASFLLKRISSYKELDFTGRLDIWKATISLIKDNLLLGTSPGSFIYNFPKYRPAGLNMFVNFAHNDYLQAASELGIFGMGLLVFIIYRIIKKGLKTHMVARTSFKTWISLALATGILSMAIHNIGDFNFYIPANVIIFTVFSGFLFNISSVKEEEYRYFIMKLNNPQARFLKFAALLVIGIAIVLMAMFTAAEAYSIAMDKAVAKNDLKAAESLGRHASRLNPFNSAYLYKLAGIYNKTAEALPLYERALYLNPMDSWSYIGLADTYYKLFNSSPANYRLKELAEANYKTGLSLDPLNSYYLKRFADFLLNTNNTGLSSEVYKKVSHVISMTKSFYHKSPELSRAGSYEAIAGLAFANSDINKAMAFYEMAENLSGNNQRAVLGQVRCYMRKFMMKRALNKYRGLTPSAKSKSTLFASMGEYYLAKGLIGPAERFSGKSIAVDLENPEGFQLRYKIAALSRGHGNAMEEFKDILDLNSVSVAITGDLSVSGDVDIRLGVSGKLNKPGSITQDVILPSGIYEFNIEARGDMAQGIGPHIRVKFNGSDVMDTYIDSEEWGYYPGIIITDYPVNRIEIIYDNDYYNPNTKEDRNLYIGSIKLKAF